MNGSIEHFCETADNRMHFQCSNLFRLWIERELNKWFEYNSFLRWNKRKYIPKYTTTRKSVKKHRSKHSKKKKTHADDKTSNESEHSKIIELKLCDLQMIYRACVVNDIHLGILNSCTHSIRSYVVQQSDSIQTIWWKQCDVCDWHKLNVRTSMWVVHLVFLSSIGIATRPSAK